MSLDSINKSLVQTYSEERLCELLPPHGLMKWVHHRGASPPRALVLGAAEGCDILAYLSKVGDSPRELKYCKKRVNAADSPSTVQIDDVLQASLDAPFKYIAEGGKSGKKRFSHIVKWYFSTKGIYDEFLNGDHAKLSERLHSALRKINTGQSAEEQRRWKRPAEPECGTPTMHEDNLEPEEPRSTYSLRSSERNRDNQEIASQLIATEQPVETLPPAGVSEDVDEDLPRLLEHLDTQNALHLMNNLHEVKDVGFCDQNHRQEALPKKLFIGRCKDKYGSIHDRYPPEARHQIYAYLRSIKSHHEVCFYRELDDDRHTISAGDVTKQDIVHPFSKTYPQSSPVTQLDKARLTLIIKYYFMAAGIVKNTLLKENKLFLDNFKQALKYINARMVELGEAVYQDSSPAVDEHSDLYAAADGPSDSYAAAFGPGNSSADTDDSDDSNSQVETNDTQVSLPTTTPPGSPPIATRDTSLHLSGAPGPSRGTKRSAEDANFEDISEKASKERERELTRQLNDAEEELATIEIIRDQALETLETKKKEFLENWNKEKRETMTKRGKEHLEAMKKRNEIEAKRLLVRDKEFKRSSMAYATLNDRRS